MPTKEIIAQRLKELMQKTPRLETQQKLMAATGLGQSTISRILNAEVNATADNVKALARTFGVKVSYLFGEDEEADAKYLEGRLPLISDVQAGDWSETIDNFYPGDAEDWIPCPFNHGPNAFVLRVAGYSMYNPGGEKSYAPGEYIAVDPGREAMNKSMVIARVDHEDKATFKQLLVDDSGSYMLQAINPSHVPRLMSMPPGSRIVGVVIGKWVPE